MIYIKTPKGKEAPILTQDVTVNETLGSLSTVNVSFYAATNIPKDRLHPVNNEFVNNHIAQTLIMPFSEIVCEGQRYYLQDPKIDDSTDPPAITLTGIQIAKQLHWKYIGKVIHGPVKHYTKTEIIKSRITEKVPYKTKTGKTKLKEKSHVVTDKKQVPAKKVEDRIELSKCLTFLQRDTKIHFKCDDDKLLKSKYSYPDGFGKGYADELLKKLSKDYGFEYKWDNLTCIIAKKLGQKDSFYFVDKVNCQKIDMEQNYSNITTRVTVYSNPLKTRKASVHKSKNATKDFKSKSHKIKRPKYKKERKTRTSRSKYKHTYEKKVISKTIDGKKVSTTKKDTKTTHGIQYKHHFTYTSPLVEKEGYPVIDVKTVYYKANFTMDELKAKAKSLVHDSPLVSYTVTGTNFEAFSKIHGKVAIGNQGFLKTLNGDKTQKARITAIESHPENNANADKITFGNFRTDPVAYQVRQQREWQELRDSYADLNDDVYDLSINSDDFLDLVNDNDSMRNNVGNWHVLNLNRINKQKEKIKKQGTRITKLEQEIKALTVSLTSKAKK